MTLNNVLSKAGSVAEANSSVTQGDHGSGACRSRSSHRRPWTIRSLGVLMAVAVFAGSDAYGQGGQSKGGGATDVLFDINGVAPAASRPKGGGGGDIVVFDIDGVAPAASRPAGGGGGGGVVWDINGVTKAASLPTVGCDFVDDFIILGPVAEARNAFWCMIDTGDVLLFGVVELDGHLEYSKAEGSAVAGGLLWLEDGGVEPLGIHLQIQF